MPKPAKHLLVNGIVAHRDKKPYIHLACEQGVFAQLTVAQEGFPEEAGAALMARFRDFRAALDDEAVEHDHRIAPHDPPEEPA